MRLFRRLGMSKVGAIFGKLLPLLPSMPGVKCASAHMGTVSFFPAACNFFFFVFLKGSHKDSQKFIATCRCILFRGSEKEGRTDHFGTCRPTVKVVRKGETKGRVSRPDPGSHSVLGISEARVFVLPKFPALDLHFHFLGLLLGSLEKHGPQKRQQSASQRYVQLRPEEKHAKHWRPT